MTVWPSRRSFLICTIAWLVAVGARPIPVATAAPANVVVIVSDDQAWTDFGFAGHKIIRTPRLDQLAAESAVFPNGYVPTSLCRASLATLLTGLYGHQHRICCNDPPDGIDRAQMLPFLRDAPTVPRLLKAQGYISLQTGKFWEGHFSNGGFTHGMTTKGRHGGPGLAIGRKTMQPIYDFIDNAGDSPFFVWYAPMLPHEPHNPPEEYLKKYDDGKRPIKLARYYAMCEWFDQTCGELLDYLDRKSLRENTLVIFVVDNGWIQETGPRKTTRGWFAPKSKLSPYDGGLRTPILLRWPGHTTPGSYDDLVSTIDLAPTILAACGVPPADQMRGYNLLARAAGTAPIPRTALYGEVFVHTAKDIEETSVNLTHLWIREGEWKLILNLGAGSASPSELYNLTQDPFEKSNIAKDQPQRVKRLRTFLRAWSPQAE